MYVCVVCMYIWQRTVCLCIWFYTETHTTSKYIKISPLSALMCKWNAAILMMYNMYALGLPAAGKLSPGRGFRRCRENPA